jgi:glycosyltransferase involved in cell wall biosynthesis
VVATIHNTARRDRAALSWQARAAHWLNLRVVRWADHVIVNSPQAMAELHALSRCSRDRVTLIPNGVDLSGYRRDEAGARALKGEWKGVPSDVLFGLVATRLDHVKGHEVFLRAAAIVAGRLPDARFVCLGTGDSDRRASLAALATELGVDGRLVWAGRRSDMPAVYSALDVLVVASFNEGGPNVIAEAMACGTPCVSTDVGCAREMIGTTGRCVQVGDSAALAAAMEEVSRASLEDAVSGQQACRDQIARSFGMTSYVERNLEVMRLTRDSVAAGRRRLGLRRRTR